MISSLNGRIQKILPESLVLELGGVGLQIFVPSPTKAGVRTGETRFFHTYLVVREDSLSLYGFETDEERDFFILLLGVNGVGPRLALAILSTLTPDAIRRAVFHDQPEVFSSVPGVGMKTAQKILLQLKDRIPAEAGMEPVAMISEVDMEVIAALTTLGYSVVEAQTALQSIPQDTPQDTPQDIEQRLRLALQYFS